MTVHVVGTTFSVNSQWYQNEHDQRRNTNFLTIFPEMKEFWNECKYYAST